MFLYSISLSLGCKIWVDDGATRYVTSAPAFRVSLPCILPPYCINPRFPPLFFPSISSLVPQLLVPAKRPPLSPPAWFLVSISSLLIPAHHSIPHKARYEILLSCKGFGSTSETSTLQISFGILALFPPISIG